MSAAAANHEIYRTENESLITGTGAGLQPLPDHKVLQDLFDDRLPSKQPQQSDNTAGPGTTLGPNPVRTKTPQSELYRDRTTPYATDDIYRQMEELDQHRKLVHELSDKIVGLNEKRVALEKENAELRRQFDNYLYTAKPSFLGSDEDLLDQTELSRRYAIIKGKLRRQAADLKEYKDKVLELQKTLIEKNEQHKEYLKRPDIGRPHYPMYGRADRDQLERQLHAKTEQYINLEEVYRKQQRVIDKLERLLDTRNNKENQEQRVNEVLRDENRLLRMQLDTLMTRQLPEQRTVAKTRTDDDNVRLQQQLEVANERIRSLEKQLEENAKKWSRERADLRLRVQISELGLNNPSPSPFPYRRPSPLPNLGTRSADRDAHVGPSKVHHTATYY